jgi:hypothetical protein
MIKAIPARTLDRLLRKITGSFFFSILYIAPLIGSELDGIAHSLPAFKG